MATRIVLTLQADLALKELKAILKADNPHLSRFQNALVSQALIDVREGLTESRRKHLGEKLLSRSGKRKLLLKRLDGLSQKLDTESFEAMESGLKKLCHQYEKAGPPGAESAG